MARRLAAAGFTRLGQLAALEPLEAARRFGEEGPVLAARARGEDPRPVVPERETRSISAETTFDADLSAVEALERPLWRMCEKLSRRLAEKGFAAGGVVLKLKTASFALRTRHARLPAPTLLPDTLFAAARPLLAREADGTAFRLIGIGAQPLLPAASADRGDLADAEAPRRAARWRAMEALRARFGEGAVVQGRGLRDRAGAG
jgi:DNA polymerase IV